MPNDPAWESALNNDSFEDAISQAIYLSEQAADLCREREVIETKFLAFGDIAIEPNIYRDVRRIIENDFATDDPDVQNGSIADTLAETD